MKFQWGKAYLDGRGAIPMENKEQEEIEHQKRGIEHKIEEMCVREREVPNEERERWVLSQMKKKKESNLAFNNTMFKVKTTLICGF